MSTTESLISRNRWLWWKELRMLAPLIALLIGIAATMLVVMPELPNSAQGIGRINDFRMLVPLVFPVLFAAGAGAVLVGQERDLRTIDWMSSLPLRPRQWVLVKLVVALIGLAVMWAIAVSSLALISDAGGLASRWRISPAQGLSNGPIGLPLWIAHSVYLTLCGFYASWKIRDQFHAILLVLALGCLPLVLAILASESLYVLQRHRVGLADLQGLMFAWIVVVTPLVGWLSYRAAMATLLPQSGQSKAKHHVDASVLPQSFWSTAPRLGSSWSSLIWQSIRSAPLALGITASCMILGMVVPLSSLSDQTNTLLEVLSPLLLLISPLAMSWLGVLVFQNDGAADRLRFLADRGVSPTKVYVARHAVPLAIFASCLIAYTIFATRRSEVSSTGFGGLVIPSLLTIAMVGWVMYTVAQFVSQVLRTLALSVIVGPIVAAMVLGWFIWTRLSLQTPTWFLVIVSLLPMLATWWLMPRFMDKRDRPHSFLMAVVVAAVIVGGPIAIAAWRIQNVGGMNATVRDDLFAEAQSIRKSSPNPIIINLAHGAEQIFRTRVNEESVPVDQAEKWIQSYPSTPTQWIPSLAELRERPAAAATADDNNIAVIFDRLMLERMKFEADANWESFSAWLSAASDIARALRKSIQWKDQDRADVLEIWIADTMSMSMVQANRSDTAYERVVRALPTKTMRNESRRRAVLATWAAQFKGKKFVGYRNSIDNGLEYQPPYLATWMQWPRSDLIVATALEALQGESISWLPKMHELMQAPSTPFQYGPYAARLRDRPAIELIRANGKSLARFWGMPWEDEIDQLIADLRTGPQENSHE